MSLIWKMITPNFTSINNTENLILDFVNFPFENESKIILLRKFIRVFMVWIPISYNKIVQFLTLLVNYLMSSVFLT